MVLLSLEYFNISPFAELLCTVITADWHFKHEDMAMQPGEIKSSETIDCLFNAANLRFAYLDYDETFQLSRKILQPCRYYR